MDAAEQAAKFLRSSSLENSSVVRICIRRDARDDARRRAATAMPLPGTPAIARPWCGKSFRPSWSRAKSRRRESPRRFPPPAIPRQVRRSDCPACRSRRSCPRPRAARCASPVPPSRCAVTNTTREACRRSVSEICAEAAAPSAAVTPGITSNSMPACAQRFHFFARAAKKQRVAALEPRDNFSFARQLHHQRINFGLRNSFCAAALSDVHHLRRWRKDAQDFLRHEIIVQHDVGGLQHAPRFARQQFRVARPRAHEINFSGHFD